MFHVKAGLGLQDMFAAPTSQFTLVKRSSLPHTANGVWQHSALKDSRLCQLHQLLAGPDTLQMLAEKLDPQGTVVTKLTLQEVAQVHKAASV